MKDERVKRSPRGRREGFACWPPSVSSTALWESRVRIVRDPIPSAWKSLERFPLSPVGLESRPAGKAAPFGREPLGVPAGVALKGVGSSITVSNEVPVPTGRVSSVQQREKTISVLFGTAAPLRSPCIPGHLTAVVKLFLQEQSLSSLCFAVSTAYSWQLRA